MALGRGLSVSMVGDTLPTTREPQSEEASSRSDLGEAARIVGFNSV